jgi:hypothetical protein
MIERQELLVRQALECCEARAVPGKLGKLTAARQRSDPER